MLYYLNDSGRLCTVVHCRKLQKLFSSTRIVGPGAADRWDPTKPPAFPSEPTSEPFWPCMLCEERRADRVDEGWSITGCRGFEYPISSSSSTVFMLRINAVLRSHRPPQFCQLLLSVEAVQIVGRLRGNGVDLRCMPIVKKIAF